MFLFKVEDLDCVAPLLYSAPPNLLKYVVAQFSKVIDAIHLISSSVVLISIYEVS